MFRVKLICAGFRCVIVAFTHKKKATPKDRHGCEATRHALTVILRTPCRLSRCSARKMITLSLTYKFTSMKRNKWNFWKPAPKHQSQALKKWNRHACSTVTKSSQARDWQVFQLLLITCSWKSLKSYSWVQQFISVTALGAAQPPSWNLSLPRRVLIWCTVVRQINLLWHHCSNGKKFPASNRSHFSVLLWDARIIPTKLWGPWVKRRTSLKQHACLILEKERSRSSHKMHVRNKKMQVRDLDVVSRNTIMILFWL